VKAASRQLTSKRLADWLTALQMRDVRMLACFFHAKITNKRRQHAFRMAAEGDLQGGLTLSLWRDTTIMIHFVKHAEI
jgi:hypothetical protein